MINFARNLIAAAFAFAFAFALAPSAWAQSWPAKPIRLIVGFTAGNSTDTIARVFSTRLGEALGQTVVVENRPGAGGNIGIETVARAAPDGYTLLHSGGSPIVVGVHLYKLSADLIKDLVPVTPTARTTMYLVVRPSLPVRSVAELVAYARANPGKLNYGSAGAGSGMHIAAEMFLHAAKIQVAHVPYKGAPQALTDLVGGHINLTFSSIPPVLQHIKAGRLQLHGISSARRSPQLPEVPTISEAGVTDYEWTTWFGLLAPARMPKPIAARLNAALVKVVRAPDLISQLEILGYDPVGGSPDEFAAFIRTEVVKYTKVVKLSGVKVD